MVLPPRSIKTLWWKNNQNPLIFIVSMAFVDGGGESTVKSEFVSLSILEGLD